MSDDHEIRINRLEDAVQRIEGDQKQIKSEIALVRSSLEAKIEAAMKSIGHDVRQLQEGIEKRFHAKQQEEHRKTQNRLIWAGIVISASVSVLLFVANRLF